MTVEAGWYYAEGDPPGTVRRWTGDEWIGFPIAAPTAEGTTPGNIAGVKPFVPIRGQVSLRVPGAIAQVGLLLVACASVFYAVSSIQVSSFLAVDGLTQETFVPDGLDARYRSGALLTGIFTFLTGLAFVTWFFMAYRNIGLWHSRRYRQHWSVLAWIVPFISLIRPMSMMFETMENSPRPDKAKDVSPIPILVWWILWVFAQFGMLFFLAAGEVEDIPRNLMLGQGVLTLFSAVAALIAVWIVQTVTDAQETRRHPTAMQLELMRQQAQLEATRGGHGILPGG